MHFSEFYFKKKDNIYKSFFRIREVWTPPHPPPPPPDLAQFLILIFFLGGGGIRNLFQIDLLSVNKKLHLIFLKILCYINIQVYVRISLI